MPRILVCALIAVLFAVSASASQFKLKNIHSAIVEPNAQLVELENIERDPTQFYLTFYGNVEYGLINMTQRSPCFNSSSPDCGKQAQDTTILLNVRDCVVSLAAAVINNPAGNQSYGIATDGRAYGSVKPNGDTYIDFTTLLRILRTNNGILYDTLLYIPAELFGRFDLQKGHFVGHAGSLTVPYLKTNGVSDGLPYQLLATWAEINTSHSAVSRLVGYRVLTPYPGLTASPYTPAATSFVQGNVVVASKKKGIYTALANLSTASGLVTITNGELIGAIHQDRDYDNLAFVRFAMITATAANGASKRYVAANMFLDLGCE